MTAAHGPYAAWASWLDAFGSGQDLPSRHLVAVDDTLGPVMQARVLRRVQDAFNTRLNAWAEALGRHLATMRDPREEAAVLVAARGRLQPLRALASDPRLPTDARTTLDEELRRLVRSVQEQSENTVRRRLRGAEAGLRTLRENSLLAAFDLIPAPYATPAGPSVQQVPLGRRVIL